jgi:uncharacterized protein (DUF427 family)
MKAMVENHVVAESADTVEHAGYVYFPPSAVRTDWLEKTEKTDRDKQCPHGVQFYDVVVHGVRHSRAAWSYESPKPALEKIAHRFGFWHEVEVC